MSTERAKSVLVEHSERERERERVLLNQLMDGVPLAKEDVLGTSLGSETAVYPAGLVADDFLPLSLAISETILVRVPSLFTLAEFEETVGLNYSAFLHLVDRGNIMPILNEYTLYNSLDLVTPIVNEGRPHLTEQRVLLSVLVGDVEMWQALVQGLRRALEVFPSVPLRGLDHDEEITVHGIHVGFAFLYALGYGDELDRLIRSYQDPGIGAITEALSRFSDGPLSQEDFAFMLTTFLSSFFSDCVGLGATGHFDLAYERVLRLPEELGSQILFLPSTFGLRLVNWLDIGVPRRLESADVDKLIGSDERAALCETLSRFKKNVETSEFQTAADEGLALRSEFAALDRAYSSMASVKRFGNALSSITFAGVPLTLAAGFGIVEGLAGAVASASARSLLNQLQGDDVAARRLFNPLLRRLAPWRMDAATYSLCQLKERILS